MRFDELKQGLSSLWDSVAEGWQHLRHTASNALTRFRPGATTNMPARDNVDDVFYMPSAGWSMLGGDLFEDEKRVIVRLEIPGMDKSDLQIEVEDGMLVVRGEKRFEREQTEGRYRVLQCAYGSFERSVPLPVAVLAEQAKANYKNGVLRVDLPKAEFSKPRKLTIQVE